VFRGSAEGVPKVELGLILFNALTGLQGKSSSNNGNPAAGVVGVRPGFCGSVSWQIWVSSELPPSELEVGFQPIPTLVSRHTVCTSRPALGPVPPTQYLVSLDSTLSKSLSLSAEPVSAKETDTGGTRQGWKPKYQDMP